MVLLSRGSWGVLGALVALGSSCKPALEGRASEVLGPTILAVRSEPAEARPGERVEIRGLALDADGRERSSELGFAFCQAPKSLKELGPVSGRCLDPKSDALAQIPTTSVTLGVLDPVACRRFGPETPVAKAGEPPGRPVDPDPSGGYYQPIRAAIADTEAPIAFGFTRLACGLAGAPAAVSAAFTARYTPNNNPRPIGLFEVQDDGAELAWPETATVGPGAQSLRLRVKWRDCPPARSADTPPAPCDGREHTVRFDLDQRVLVDVEEAIRVSWYSTPGATFDADRTGREATDPSTVSENTLVLEEGTDALVLAVVLRDDRGGTGWWVQRLRRR
ncbi:MAG: hypothetical protein U1E65_03380 [Myxococcota bacterium]